MSGIPSASMASPTDRLLAAHRETWARQDAWLARMETRQRRIARAMWLGWALASIGGFGVGFMLAWSIAGR